jgi:hypothetical protein
MAKVKRTKGQTIIYKTLHRKQILSNTNPTKNRGMNLGALEELAVPAPLVTPVMLF